MNNEWLYEIVEDDCIDYTDSDWVYFDEMVEDEDPAAISLCTLSAINWGNMKTPADFEKACTLAVRGLDALLDYQKYPVLAAELSTMKRRPIGIGIINFAYWLAKHDSSYQNPNLELVDEWAEAWSYYLIKASADLAVERGACPGTPETLYGEGITPNMTYKKDVDELVPHQERQPWKELREQLKRTGIRNSTLMALMPAECQSLYNEIMLKDGSSQMLGKFIEEHSIVNINEIHATGIPGQRYALKKPVELADGNVAHEIYYNGYQDVTEIEMEDGSIYKFTSNHKLRVVRDDTEQWITVAELEENDDILSI